MNISNIKRKIIQAVKITIQNNIKDNFVNESFDGASWKKRKSKDKSDRKNPENSRRLLTKTGRLLRSVIVDVKKDTLQVCSDVPYAEIHNTGGEINHPGGTPYTFFDTKYTERKKIGRIEKLKSKQMLFLKKDGKYPDNVKFTKPHLIKIPKRQFVGDSKLLRTAVEQRIKDILKQDFKIK